MKETHNPGFKKSKRKRRGLTGSMIRVVAQNL